MPYLAISLCILALLSVTSGYGQTHLDSLLTNEAFATGDSLQRVGEYQEAIPHLEAVAAEYRRAGRWEDYFYTENKISENLWRLAKYDTAWQLVQRVREQSEERLGEGHATGLYTYFNVAFLHHIYGRYEEALANYHTALAIAQRHPDRYPLLYDDLYHGASISYTDTDQYDSAFTYCRRGLAIRKKQEEKAKHELAKSYAQLGAVHDRIGNVDSSLWYNRRALAIQLASTGENHLYTAQYWEYIGRNYLNLDTYDSASHYYNRALATYTNILGERHYYTAVAQRELGDIYYEQGAYQTSLAYYQQAATTFVTLFGPEHPTSVQCYGLIGSVYLELGENTKAEKNYRWTLHLSLITGGNAYDIYNNLSNLYIKLEEYDSALWYSRQALAEGQTKLDEQDSHLAFTYHTTGDIFRRQSQYDSALWYYNRARTVLSDHQLSQHALGPIIYRDQGQVYRAQGQYERALASLQRSLDTNRQGGVSPIPSEATLNSSAFINSQVLLSTVQAQAQTLRAYYEHTNNIDYLAKAFRTYLRYDSLMGQIQTDRYDQKDKLFTQKVAKEVYEEGLSVGMLLYQITQDPTYGEAMFRLAERSRMIGLRSALAAVQAEEFSGVPPAVVQQENQLKLRQVQYQSLLQAANETGDTIREQRYRRILFTTRQRYDSLTASLKERYPRYYALKHDNQVLSATNLQKNLADNEMAIEYFVGDRTGYAFAITPRQVEITTFPIDTSLAYHVRQLRNSIQPRTSQASYRGFVASASALYQKLIRPVLKDHRADKLLLIPDGVLNFLPFELLLTEAVSSGPGSYQTLPYLIRSNQLSYSYSATWHFSNRSNLPPNGSLSYLAVAPTYGNDEALAYGTLRSEVTPLQWNQREADGLQAYLPGSILTGTAATEQRFKEQAAQHGILHLATHALVDNERPEQSGLVFAPPTDSTSDGLLRIHELYAMELPAQLAVLSACNTGMGKLEKGEGAISLARAFAYAGCPSVVMSHWAVDDQATAQLMDHFYQYLTDGLPKDEALRQAKLTMLATDGPANNPFYWASFVVVGDTQPLLSIPGYDDWLTYALGGGLVLIILLATNKLRERAIRKHARY